MNYLVHLFLAEDEESLVGNMMGDFVKGRLDDRYPPGVRRGLEMHRKIDSFAAGNVFFLRSKHRIDDSYRHYRGILVDVFYDHFLARTWADYSPVPFPDFIRNAYRILDDYREIMPDRLREVLPRMFSSNWLLSYQEIDGVDSILRRMSTRVSRPNPLANGVSELSAWYDRLHGDFRGFMPELIRFAKQWNQAGQ
jgi:acyl carrier protein phosphodiesterase